METRIRLFKKKQESLKKNPNLFVSKTRLSLRELDKRLNEKTFAEFINCFINDWKQNLPKEELKVVKTQKLVLQYKLLTDKEKTGEDGKPKPSGIGFIELGNEDLALYLVNNLNNFIMNKRTGKGLIVDFAIEDHRKLLKRKQKLESLKRKQKEAQRDKEKKTLKDKRNKKDKEPEAEAEPEVKVTIDQISDIKELEKMMRDTKSRGKRNRIKKRIQTLSSGSHPPPTTVSSVKKQTEAEPEENSEDDGGVELSQATREMMKKAMKNENKEIENSIKNDIKRNIRKKKHLKMKKEEDFDDVFKVFEAKINKRLKMIEDAGEEDQKDKDEWEFRNVEIEDI